LLGAIQGAFPDGFPAGFPGFGFMDREENISDSELPDLISEDGHSDNEQENDSSDHDELPDLGLALWKLCYSKVEGLLFSLKTSMSL
jgi:hypothetical protein